PGARLVAFETLPPHFPPYLQALWVRPGPYLDPLAEGGRLLPIGFPSALPEGALAGSIFGPENGTLELAMGEGFGIRVKSAGSTPWPHLPGLRRLDHRVVLHVRWWAESAEPVAADAVDLPRMVFPGDTVYLEVPAPHTPGGSDAPGTWAPLGPGEYRVSLEIDQYLEDRWRGHDGAAEQVQVRIR
ncbi:MAG: hypothetical protein MI919_22390, partial [Holophagales bacterium]|nr:hypothetical protein [Holophagales bacterium]